MTNLSRNGDGRHRASRSNHDSRLTVRSAHCHGVPHLINSDCDAYVWLRRSDPFADLGDTQIEACRPGNTTASGVCYEIDKTKVIVGNTVTLPWQLTIGVASDCDVRLTAAGVAAIGDLRCQITGNALPMPIIVYDSNPYLSVECPLRSS